MFGYYFTIGLFYLIIGFGVALISYFLFKNTEVPGKFIGALIVALVGSYLGGILEYALKGVIDFLTHVNGNVNIFPPLITAVILLWIFDRVSSRNR